MTSVNVAEWEWASQEHPPQFPARELWRIAVTSVAVSARRALPASRHRINQAVKLILAGHVELLSDGTAKVASQNDPKTIYQVKGTGCTCPDALYRAKDGWCKHIFAVLIVKRATTLVKQRLGARENRGLPTQGCTSGTATEAPKSEDVPAACALTFPVSGVEVMLTLHGANEQALFPRIRHALAWAKGLGACMTNEEAHADKNNVVTQKHQRDDHVP